MRSRVVVVRFGESERQLWSITEAGKAWRITFPGVTFKMTVGRLGAGSDAPLPSPDGKHVAYVEGTARDGQIVVREIAEGSSPVTIRTPPRSELYITEWAADGRRLLYATAPLDGPKGVIADPDGSDLLFSVYDVKSGTSRKVAMPCQYVGWLPTDELLGICSATLTRIRDGEKLPLPKRHEQYSQVNVSEGGTIACVVDDKGVEQVIAFDAGTLMERVVSDTGKWADFQFPKASPAGTHVAWENRVPLGQGRYRADLVVNQKTIAEDIGDFEWIDEETIAVIRAAAPPTVAKVR